MATRTPPVKRCREMPVPEALEVALAAIASYKKQKEVSDFITFLLAALERNADWLNSIVDRQKDFRCAMLVGAGPNRFHLKQILYPCDDDEINLEIEMKDSDDHDKVAVAAIVNLTNEDLESFLKYMKTRIHENTKFREDICQGKTLGISFAVLRPFAENQYRVAERIAIGSSLKCVLPVRKRRKDEKLLTATPRRLRKLV